MAVRAVMRRRGLLVRQSVKLLLLMIHAYYCSVVAVLITTAHHYPSPCLLGQIVNMTDLYISSQDNEFEARIGPSSSSRRRDERSGRAGGRRQDNGLLLATNGVLHVVQGFLTYPGA